MSFSVAEVGINELGLFGVFLLDGAGLGVLESNDEVILGLGAALVGSEHDREAGLVEERLEIDTAGLLVSEQLDVGAAALERVLELDLVLNDERFAARERERLRET